MDARAIGVSELFICDFGQAINHPDAKERERSRELFAKFAAIGGKAGFESIMMLPGLSAMDGVRLRMVKLVAEEGGMIELLEYASHSETRPPGNRLCEIGPTHVAFTVADVEETYREWSAKGIPSCSRPQLSPDGKATVAFCRDPDGTFLEIVEELQESS